MAKPQNLSEALTADIEYQNLGMQRTFLTKQIQEIQKAQAAHFWSIQALLRAADLCDSKRSEIVGEDDEVLVRATGECSDCWDSNWFASKGAIFASVETICKQIAEMSEAKELNVKSRDENEADIDAALQRVREDFHAQQQS